MEAVVLTIGDEILLGQVLNTNAAYLSTKLYSLGIPVTRSVTLPDEKRTILDEFKSSLRQYDVIIVTGGLGPTHDDITMECIAEFFNSKLVTDKKSLQNIKNLFAKRKLQMPAINVRQALVPEKSLVLKNDVGTAPGIIIEKSGKIFCALPGVPAEMKSITEKSLLPFLKKKLHSSFPRKRESGVIKYQSLHTIGIAESLLFEKIGNVSEIETARAGLKIKLAFLPSNFEVRIRITVFAQNQKSADKEIKSAVSKLKSRIGRYIYSYDENPVEKIVGDILKKKHLKLSVAESCTGGLIASKITDNPGSSEYFLESITAYSNDSKKKLLGVKESTLKKFGAVSRQTAVEMAEGVRKTSCADIGLSTTGIAGPSGGTKTKPAGLVWIGYSGRNGSFAKEFYFTGTRLRNKEIMSKMALELLRRKLLKFPLFEA